MSMDANNESETKSTLAFGTRSVRNRKLGRNYPFIYSSSSPVHLTVPLIMLIRSLCRAKKIKNVVTPNIELSHEELKKRYDRMKHMYEKCNSELRRWRQGMVLVA